MDDARTSPISASMQACIDNSSWIRQMFEEGNRLKEQYGEDEVFDFTLGNPSVPPPTRFREVMIEVARQSRAADHRYMTNIGLLETRKFVAERAEKDQGKKLSPDHVVMTCGAAGGLNIFLRSVLDPDDEVILLAPYFPEYTFYVQNHGGRPVVVQTDADFQLDLDAIAAALTPRTRAIIINSPNNPTGVVYDAERIEALGRLVDSHAEETGAPIYLVSDEPYRRIVYDDVEQGSVLRSCKRSLVCTSFSKDLGLAGERIGYVLLNPDLPGRDRVFAALAIATRTLGFVNAPAFMQRILPHCGALEVDVNAYRANRDAFVDGLTAAGYDMPSPRGAFFLFPAVPGGDDVAFCAALREHRVLTVPGCGFGRPGHMRISYAVERETIERSIEHFAEVMKQTKSRLGIGAEATSPSRRR